RPGRDTVPKSVRAGGQSRSNCESPPLLPVPIQLGRVSANALSEQVSSSPSFRHGNADRRPVSRRAIRELHSPEAASPIRQLAARSPPAEQWQPTANGLEKISPLLHTDLLAHLGRAAREASQDAPLAPPTCGC